MTQDKDDQYESSDESEYHFSDDQVNYEVEPETKVTAALPAANPLSNFKRPLLGLVAFAVLIFLVYKILTPATVVPTTRDFASGRAMVKKPVVIEPERPKQLAMATETHESGAPVEIAPPQPVSAPATTAMAAPAPMVTPSQEAVAVAAVPTTAPAVVPPELEAKISSLEEQNTKMQSDYTQKLAGLAAQNTALQGKVQELTLRLASMETTITRLSQNLQQIKNNKSTMEKDNLAPAAEEIVSTTTTTTKAAPSKMTYSVQAIIPGRAWLKSEAGDTVTVAEGDTLKDFGRVTKIDPYDGVVEVDVGGKTVSLSYGAGV